MFFDQDGVPGVERWLAHGVDTGNQITTVYDSDFYFDPKSHVQDLAGNLVWDGKFFYQYDGFNRLVQVNRANQLTPALAAFGTATNL